MLKYLKKQFQKLQKTKSGVRVIGVLFLCISFVYIPYCIYQEVGDEIKGYCKDIYQAIRYGKM